MGFLVMSSKIGLESDFDSDRCHNLSPISGFYVFQRPGLVRCHGDGGMPPGGRASLGRREVWGVKQEKRPGG